MGRTKQYRGDGIVVSFEPARCIHAARCVNGLPSVFDPERRPWIDPTQAEADAVAESVRKCPTGALTYLRTDGGPAEQPDTPSIHAVRDGPLYVRGPIRIEDHEGNLFWSGNRAALCRCGASAIKPFCDGAHEDVGFTTAPAEAAE